MLEPGKWGSLTDKIAHEQTDATNVVDHNNICYKITYSVNMLTGFTGGDDKKGCLLELIQELGESSEINGVNILDS